MTAVSLNAVGCMPVDGECLEHGEELVCSHGCERAHWEHHGECADQPPASHPAAYDSDCIGCGKAIAEGEPARMYEEGYVHAHGCPESSA